MFSSFRHPQNAKKRLWDALFLLVWLATAYWLFRKCRYGFGNIDESFYLTLPKRLMQGDALFLHEWHLSQMSAFLLTPITALVLQLNQGTEGIILAMRYATTLLQCLLALAAYLRLRKHSRIGSAFAALCFMLYTPFGVMALSYNSLGILLLAGCGLLLLPAQKHPGAWAFAAGVCFAMAVLCCPYLMLVYLAYVFATVIRTIVRRKNAAPAVDSFLSIPILLWFTAGAAIVALAFAVFVLSRAPIDGILQSFSQIMNDPEHPPMSIGAKVIEYIDGILRATPGSKFVYPLLAALFIACLADRRRKDRPLVYFIPAAACVLLLMLDHYFHWQYLNMTLWSINALALFVPLLSKRKICLHLFQLIWIPGMMYTFCLHLSSNQKFFAVCSASIVATLGSAMMVAVYMLELVEAADRNFVRRCLCGLLCVIVGFQLFSEADLRWRKVFWEDGVETQTVLLSEGIQAGLLVSEEKADLYGTALRNLEAMRPYAGKKLLYLSRNTWYYLVHDCEIAAYSAWLSGVDANTVDRLEAYYAINPDKMPDAVFADAEHRETAVLLCERLGFRSRDVEGGVILEK